VGAPSLIKAARRLMPASLSQTAAAPQRQVVEYVAQQHARSLPLEVSGSDADSVSQWFRGKVDFAVTPPAFHSDSIKLVGGRLSHVGDEQAAYLVYEQRGRPVTVVVFPDDQQIPFGGVEQRAGGRDVYLGQSLGYNVAMWRQGGVNYAVSSDLDQRDMIQLVSTAQ
jgi:anti-sigma factor RsiW